MYTVAFPPNLAAPIEIRAEVRLRLHEVANTLGTISEHANAVWASLAVSELQIDVRGWRFFYRVDRGIEEIQVVRVTPPV